MQLERVKGYRGNVPYTPSPRRFNAVAAIDTSQQDGWYPHMLCKRRPVWEYERRQLETVPQQPSRTAVPAAWSSGSIPTKAGKHNEEYTTY